MEKALLTVDEVAEMLHLGRTKIYELLRSGDIDSVSIGAARRIPAGAVESFVDELTQGSLR